MKVSPSHQMNGITQSHMHHQKLNALLFSVLGCPSKWKWSSWLKILGSISSTTTWPVFLSCMSWLNMTANTLFLADKMLTWPPMRWTSQTNIFPTFIHLILAISSTSISCLCWKRIQQRRTDDSNPEADLPLRWNSAFPWRHLLASDRLRCPLDGERARFGKIHNIHPIVYPSYCLWVTSFIYLSKSKFMFDSNTLRPEALTIGSQFECCQWVTTLWSQLMEWLGNSCRVPCVPNT